MAKHGAKAAAIREYIEKNPTAKAKDVIDALARRRIEVSANQVYPLLAKSNGHGPAPHTDPPAEPRAEPKTQSNYEPLFHAKTLVAAVGGIDKAREALAALEKLLA